MKRHQVLLASLGDMLLSLSLLMAVATPAFTQLDHPNRRSACSAGSASGGHLVAELYKVATGVKVQHIPYEDTGPAMTDLLAGHYDLTRYFCPSCHQKRAILYGEWVE